MNATTRTTHTPGPWKSARAFQNNGPDYFVVSTGQWRSPAIATCNDEANARLIAAAPDLLEGCKLLLELVGNGVRPEISLIKNLCGPLVAKAEGKE